MARVSDVTHNNGHRSALPGENSPLALGRAHAAAPSDTRRHDFVRRRREPRQRAGGRLESWYPARRGERACRGARAVPHRVAGAERSPQGFTDRSGPMVVRGDIGRGTWYFVVDIGAAAGRRQQVRRRGFATKKAATEAEAEVIADAGRGIVCVPGAGNGWGVPHGAVVASPTGRPAAVDHPRLRQGHPSSDRLVPRRRSTRSLDAAMIERFYARRLPREDVRERRSHPRPWQIRPACFQSRCRMRCGSSCCHTIPQLLLGCRGDRTGRCVRGQRRRRRRSSLRRPTIACIPFGGSLSLPGCGAVSSPASGGVTSIWRPER